MLITILLIIFIALLLIFKLLEATWVFCDATCNGVTTPIIWAVLVFFLPFAIFAYLFARPTGSGTCIHRGNIVNTWQNSSCSIRRCTGILVAAILTLIIALVILAIIIVLI